MSQPVRSTIHASSSHCHFPNAVYSPEGSDSCTAYDWNLYTTADQSSVNQNVQCTYKAQIVYATHFLNSCAVCFKPTGSAVLLWFFNFVTANIELGHPSVSLVIQELIQTNDSYAFDNILERHVLILKLEFSFVGFLASVIIICVAHGASAAEGLGMGPWLGTECRHRWT